MLNARNDAEEAAIVAKAGERDRVTISTQMAGRGTDIRLGEGVVASGWSVEDGVVEAIEVPERRFALGVLWHPEEDEASRVVNALVEETR